MLKSKKEGIDSYYESIHRRCLRVNKWLYKESKRKEQKVRIEVKNQIQSKTHVKNILAFFYFRSKSNAMNFEIEKLNLDCLNESSQLNNSIAIIDRNSLSYYQDNEIDLNAIVVCKNLKLSTTSHGELIRAWKNLTHKPTVVLFDLDLTLWPFWIDTVSSIIPLRENKKMFTSVSYASQFFLYQARLSALCPNKQ